MKNTASNQEVTQGAETLPKTENQIGPGLDRTEIDKTKETIVSQIKMIDEDGKEIILQSQPLQKKKIDAELDVTPERALELNEKLKDAIDKRQLTHFLESIESIDEIKYMRNLMIKKAIADAPEKLRPFIPELSEKIRWDDDVSAVNFLENVRLLMPSFLKKYGEKELLSHDELQEMIDYMNSEMSPVRELTLYLTEFEEFTKDKLPENFAKDYPLLARKLDTPKKIRIFSRAAEFCEGHHRLAQNTLGSFAYLLEKIIKKHEISGKNEIELDLTTDAQKLCYTQLQPRSLRAMLFPGAHFGWSEGRGGDRVLITWEE